MKFIRCLFVLFLLFAILAPCAYAEDCELTICLDGRRLEFAENAHPVLRDGSTYLPVTKLAEIMGIPVSDIEPVIEIGGVSYAPAESYCRGVRLHCRMVRC